MVGCCTCSGKKNISTKIDYSVENNKYGNLHYFIYYCSVMMHPFPPPVSGIGLNFTLYKFPSVYSQISNVHVKQFTDTTEALLFTRFNSVCDIYIVE